MGDVYTGVNVVRSNQSQWVHEKIVWVDCIIITTI